MKKLLSIAMAAGLGCLMLGTALAQELQGEIVALSGAATIVRAGGAQEVLREGDVVQVDDTIQVGADAAATLALDGDMENVVYLGEDTELTVRSIYPTDLKMTRGDVLSKLGALPQGSTYQVETPIGVAAVRGSEFRTVYDGKSGMEVFNLAHSNVYVFNQDADGKLSETPVVVPREQKTAMARRGVPPVQPQKIPRPQLNEARVRQNQLQKGVERRIAQGHAPKIPRIGEVKRLYKEKVGREGRPGPGGQGPLVSRQPGQRPGERQAIEAQNRMMKRMDGADKGRREPGAGPVKQQKFGGAPAGQAQHPGTPPKPGEMRRPDGRGQQPQGQPGQPHPQGQPVQQGQPGQPGKPGQPGQQMRQGPQGQQVQKGQPGQPGKPDAQKQRAAPRPAPRKADK